MTLPYKSPGWTTAPISPTCEHLDGSGFKDMRYCGLPTDYAYPAHESGWMALCRHHGKHHMPHIFHIDEVIAAGERFEGAPPKRIELAKCLCGNVLTDEELHAGYMDAATRKPICEGCWDSAQDDML